MYGNTLILRGNPALATMRGPRPVAAYRPGGWASPYGDPIEALVSDVDVSLDDVEAALDQMELQATGELPQPLAEIDHDKFVYMVAAPVIVLAGLSNKSRPTLGLAAAVLGAYVGFKHYKRSQGVESGYGAYGACPPTDWDCLQEMAEWQAALSGDSGDSSPPRDREKMEAKAHRPMWAGQQYQTPWGYSTGPKSLDFQPTGHQPLGSGLQAPGRASYHQQRKAPQAARPKVRPPRRARGGGRRGRRNPYGGYGGPMCVRPKRRRGKLRCPPYHGLRRAADGHWTCCR